MRGRAPTSTGPDGVTALSAYVVCLLLIPAPMVLAAFGQVGGPSTLLALACFLWWAWERLRVGPSSGRGARSAVRAVAVGYLVVVLVVYAHSAGLALPPSERSPADGALVRTIGLVGLVCVACDGINARDRLWTLVRRMSFLWGAICLVIVAQIATGEVWVDRVSLPGLTAPEGLTLIKRGLLTRPSGTSTHPIELSAVMAMTMPLVMAAAARERRHPWLLRLIAVAMPTVLLLNGSRTAVVCGFVAFTIMLAAWRPQVRLLAGVGALGVVSVLFVTMPGFVGSIRGLFVGASEDPSITSRTESYAMVLTYWSEHPWLGRGVGTFLPQYWILDNQYLNLLIGGGAVTLGSFLVLIVVAARSASQAARAGQDEDDRHLAIALLAGVVAGAVSWALFDAAAFPQASGTFFLLVGLCGAAHRILSREAVGHSVVDDAPVRTP